MPNPDYLSRDYAGIKKSLQEYAQQIYPEWQPSSEGDFGMVMLEMFAYMGDVISYYTDRAQFENYLPTATQRDSILNLAFMLGYTPNSGTPATGTVPLTSDKGTPALTVPAGTQITTNRVEALDGPVVFETNDDIALPANPNGTAAAVTANVTEGTTETYQFLGESTGQPGQVLSLPHTGVYRESIRLYVEDGTGSTIINPGVNQILTREWVQVEKLLEAIDTDQVFEARFTDRTTDVLLGDDINGQVPATGLRLYATYRHGFGASGNVALGTVRLINSTGSQGLGAVKVAKDSTGVYLSSAMTGGADPEDDDSIRFNAPRSYRTQNRVVNEQDYIDVALGTEGVTKANVVSLTFTSVTVYITGPDGGAPTQSLMDAVADRFIGKTLAGVTVQVAAPTFVPIQFGESGTNCVVTTSKTYSNKAVLANVRRALRKMVAAKPFGEKMTVGESYRTIMSVEGVRSVDITVMARADVGGTLSGTVTVTPKSWEVFTVGSTFITVTGGVA